MIPNIITTFRLFLVPVFAYLMLIVDNLWGACTVLVISALSDIIDGIIARKFNMITDTGKVYDPLVDKLMQITALFALSVRGFVPVWCISIIIAKELIMILVGLILYLKKIIVQASWYGKMTTVIFYIVMLLLVIFKDMPYFVNMLLLLVLVASVLFSAFAYGRQLISFKKEVDQIGDIN
ncbi:MAG: CDP-alcohol phosphatidyltransferase family protein [Clostridia bacterium]|nr:CDP-alcohol phosphatidyltransferase family protein [Clostridia bacterium]